MSPKKQRVVIAEVCGWTFHSPYPFDEESKLAAIACWIRPQNDPWQTENLPNYLDDLNAMNSAEDIFYNKKESFEGAKLMSDYSKILCSICEYPLHASASQRGEAFLKTLGLWEETS